MSIAVPEFKSVMRQFATGITVLTIRAENRFYGLTVNTLTSVSLAPPLILVCVDRHTPMHTTLPLAGVFAVNILAVDQANLSDRFAGRHPEITDRFYDLEITEAITGAPVIRSALAYLDCRLWATYDGGDHSIFVGLVEDGAVMDDRDPLVHLRSRYGRWVKPD
ncbi:MAG: flavin reductase family protein [Chloroflexi bacterium]|nr:flavin reductase family protein [Chloroflexota bacterium]